MNLTSAIAIFISALILIPLGAPVIILKIIKIMTGEQYLSFAAFSWETLQGAAISLGIGLFIYIFLIRLILSPDKRDKNLWPDRFNLEKYIYTPVLTRWLPAILGQCAALFAENIILKPFCAYLVYIASIIGRALDQSLDALIMLARRTIAREVAPRDGRIQVSAPRRLHKATSEALRPLTESFSFVLLMTCLGIILILGVLTVLLVKS